MKKSLFLVLFICAAFRLQAQVSIQFIPEIHGRNVQGLFNARIINAAGAANVRLLITVTEQKGGQIVGVQTSPFNLVPGSNLIPSSAVRGAIIQPGQGAMARLVQQNGYFPQGDYEFTFEVFAMTSGQTLSTQTFNYEVVPLSPLTLISPFDGDKICEKRPMFTWQPSLPKIPGALYLLQLAEIKEGQNATEALNYNLPIINQGGIMNNLLPYPATSKELQEGRKYAWQVSAYNGQTVLNRSEIWEFTVDCAEDIAEKITDDGYRDIEDLLKGNYYVAMGEVRFAMVNSYAPQKLQYKIDCITEPGRKVKKLPGISIKTGKNKVVIPLKYNAAFRDGYSYIMSVRLPNGSTRNLRFIYREPLE